MEGIEDEVSSSNEKYNVWSTSFSYHTSNTRTVQLPSIPEMLVVIEYGNLIPYAAMTQVPGVFVVDSGKYVKFSLDESILTLRNLTDFTTTVNITIYIWYK